MLLAHVDAERRHAVLERGLPRVGPETITDPAELDRVLDQVRSSGVATERSESAAGVACVAALLPTPDEHVLAAVSISGPEESIDLVEVTAALERTMADARRSIERLPRDLRKI